MTTTAFTATLRNCSILMFAQAEDYDGKTELDEEVKHLQAINGLSKPEVPAPSGEKNNSPTPDAESGLYDNANELVSDEIKHNWHKKRQDNFLAMVSYTANGSEDTRGEGITVGCNGSINSAISGENLFVQIYTGAGYSLTDISYSGLHSLTYVRGPNTVLIARVKNCGIQMLVTTYTKDKLDEEVKYLQQINELNDT